MPLRLGELLIRQGILVEPQVRAILEEQQRTGRPFGQLAEQMYGIDARDVEHAWAVQYAQLCERVNLESESIDPDVLALVSRRQAWQFMVFPLRRDGSEIVIATTPNDLPRAARFIAWHLGEPVYFVLTTQKRLVKALRRHCSLPGADFIMGERHKRRGNRSA
ncbi:MAG: hypothetical protein HND57_15785 [Planctomycetes bacterium]|nr:hypothetical protein [Planctomycetota bacterium]